MNKRAKLIIVNVIVTLSILVGLETVFYLRDPNHVPRLGFLIRTNHFKIGNLDNAAFNQVDPLLGYTQTEARLRARGFKVEFGAPVLYTSSDSQVDYKIYITGGSTSDLWYRDRNWPVAFTEILKEHGIKAKIFAAGVVGWTSGQELLKLIRDGLNTGPTIHISYSGNNDVFDSSYITGYEQGFYEKEFADKTTFWLLPNTVLWFRNALHLNDRDSINDIILLGNLTAPCDKFWERNCSIMHGIAVQMNYHFVGFLQPTLGSGKFKQTIPGVEKYTTEVKKYFPEFKKVVQLHPDFLVDLTGIFDTCKGNVFIDNCHVNDDWQRVVAQNIFDALVEKGYLKVDKAAANTPSAALLNKTE